ncbi:MAG: hypothetical protein V4545_08060 [Pseudomonadota bacterium]
MHNNYILKQAVIAALTLLSISMQSQVFAVGLGDIEVKSHIGQPLQAKIKVQGVEGLKDQACFRLGDDTGQINHVSRAQLKLGNIKGDEAVLSITTTDVMNEPIVSLSVIAECDSTFTRDYVLLIDPLLTTEIEQASDEEVVNSVEIADTVVAKPTVRKSPVATPTYSQTIRVKPVSAKNLSATTKAESNNIVLSDSTAKKPTNLPINNESKPRLSISGAANDNQANMIALRLDKQLHFSADTAPQALASTIAIEDEATVLSNRLAHLEQQITSLQQRNRALEAEKQLQQQTAQPIVASSLFTGAAKWWPYLAGLGLLIGGYFAADYWRRRRQTQQLTNAEDVWNVLDANSNSLVYYKDAELEDTLFENKAETAANLSTQKNAEQELAEIEASQAASEPIQVEEDIFEHNILDHADVFLSHGRTSLAIQLLQNHLMDFPKQSVTIWLFLLDLLAKENLQAMYEQTTLECKEHFNIRIAAFSNDEASPKQKLEDFPRLMAGLEQAWGSPAASVYLDDLIYNSRLENRVGFEKSVLEELILLRSIAQTNVNKADVIQLDEKKMAIKEMKEAKLAASKADKLQKLEELTLLEAEKANVSDAEEHVELFEFNLIEYK